MEDPDDSQGKKKAGTIRSEWTLIYAALFIGVCLGFLWSQTVYVWVVKSQSMVERMNPTSSIAKVQASAKKPRSGLEEALMNVAPDKEVMIAISNYNLILGGQLTTWLETVRQAKVTNYLVVAIDKQLNEYLIQHNFNTWLMEMKVAKVQEGTGDNHAISALKFKIIKSFLDLGWSVLLSDVDVVVIQDPFKFLYRDHDIENMSDGFDDATAYGRISGLDDPSMGWARYAQGTEHLNLNSGLFYIRANERTIGLMARVAARLEKEKAWDQSVYNQEIFYLSHGSYLGPNVSVRVMDIFLFMNSKVLFKQVRHQPREQQRRPVMCHMNYHPDKHERMKAAIEYFIKGNDNALKGFPGGSEAGS